MTDLQNLPKIHPRERHVNASRVIVAEAIQRTIVEHDLTYGEIISILSMEIAGWAKNAIRAERNNVDA